MKNIFRMISLEKHRLILFILNIVVKVLYLIVFISLYFSIYLFFKYNFDDNYILYSTFILPIAIIFEIITKIYEDWIIDQQIIYYHREDEFTIRRKNGKN